MGNSHRSDARRVRMRPTPLIHSDSYYFNPHPERVEFMTAALAEVIVLVAAALVVEAEPELFLVFAQSDLERLARRQAFLHAGRFGLGQQSERMARFRR